MPEEKDQHHKLPFNRRTFIKAAGALAVLATLGFPLLGSSGWAKDSVYPAGKITCYVPNAPGGGYDTRT
jgi:hypothetical protein